jgi:hypothetical protein
MTLLEARELLTAVRAGKDASEAQITEALRATGDIDFEVVIHAHRPVGSWESLLPSQRLPVDPFEQLHSVCGPRTQSRIERESAR